MKYTDMKMKRAERENWGKNKSIQ